MATSRKEGAYLNYFIETHWHFVRMLLDLAHTIPTIGEASQKKSLHKLTYEVPRTKAKIPNDKNNSDL